MRTNLILGAQALCFTASRQVTVSRWSEIMQRDRDSMESRAEQAGRRIDESMGEPGSTGTQGRPDASQRATQFSEQTRGKADEARQKADEGMNKAAEGMEGTAGKLRERAESMGGMQAKAGEKVADGMEKTAGYLRDKDTQQIMDDVEKYVKEHPMQAVAGALVGGFLISRILR
jgi:ElaB/YqjD/DUF883 family membrane-anchored ribosome-binding protein